MIVKVFVLGMFVLKTPENRLMYIVVDKHQRAALKFLVYVNWLFTKQMNKVMNMFNHNLLSPFSSLSTEDVICLQKLLTVCVWLYFCLHVTKGRGVVRQTLCGALQRSVDYEALLHPYRSKERGDVWSHIAINLNGFDHPKFQVNKRSTRDRLTLLITKNKTDMRQEENASGIACEETELDQALKEIIDKEKLANEKGSETLVNKHF